MAQELISHKVLSLDFWQDTVTYAGRKIALKKSIKNKSVILITKYPCKTRPV